MLDKPVGKASFEELRFIKILRILNVILKFNVLILGYEHELLPLFL